MSLFGAVADSYVASAPSASFATVAAALSPGAWYRLGDATTTTMTDSSGNGRNGTYTVVSGWPHLGQTGLVTGDSTTSAAFTDGIGTPGIASYASWMDSPTALSLFVIAKTTASGNMFMLGRDDGTNRVWQFTLNSGKFGFTKIATVVTATSPAAYNDGAIHDFGATYDGSNIRLYVDGVKVTTTAAAGSLGTAHCNFAIGARNNGNNPFGGNLQEAMVANAVWADSDFAALHAAR